MDIATHPKTKGLKATALSALLGCSKGHASELARGVHKPGKKIALKLEAVTGTPWWKWVERS